MEEDLAWWRDALFWRRVGSRPRCSLDLGFLISFAGNVTYPKAQPLREVACRVPLGDLLVETDAPWLAPAPIGKAQRAGVGGAQKMPKTAKKLLGLTHENFSEAVLVGADVGN